MIEERHTITQHVFRTENGVCACACGITINLHGEVPANTPVGMDYCPIARAWDVEARDRVIRLLAELIFAEYPATLTMESIIAVWGEGSTDKDRAIIRYLLPHAGRV